MSVGVLILDEPQDLSSIMRAALKRAEGIHLVGEAPLKQADAEAMVALVCLEESQLADGIARIVGLKKRRSNLLTLIAFDALNAKGFQALLDAGADAFVGRSQSPQELRTALLALVEGSAYLVSPKRRGTTIAARSSNSGLTLREMQVLRLLCAGFSNKEVARQLAMSVRTVETHRLNLRRKTRTGQRKELVSLAHQLGLPLLSDSELSPRGDR